MFVSQKNNRKDGGGSGLKIGMEAVRMSMLNGSSLGSSYDRSHITGSVSLKDSSPIRIEFQSHIVYFKTCRSKRKVYINLNK